jgi:hypothetical protein
MQFSRVDYSIYIQDAFENSTSLSSVFYNPRPLTPPPCPPNTQSVLSKAEKKETERDEGEIEGNALIISALSFLVIIHSSIYS